MDQLKIGDMVRSGNGSFTAVYSFGHFAPNAELEFPQIETDAHNTILEITGDHMVYIMEYMSIFKEYKRVLVPARDIQVGDHLRAANNHRTLLLALPRVTAIRKVQRRGAYAPFTFTGDLMVNDVIASNYIALPPTFQQAGLSFENQHWLQHIVFAPHRLYCRLVGVSEHETYNEGTGLSKAVMFWLPALEWMEGHSLPTFSTLSFTEALAICLVLLGLTHFLVDNVGWFVWKTFSLSVKAALYFYLAYFLLNFLPES